MKITYRPPFSPSTEPVFVDQWDNVMDPAIGIRKVLEMAGGSKEILASVCGVSPRTVEGWLATKARPIPTLCMLRLKLHLEGLGDFNPKAWPFSQPRQLNPKAK